MPICICFSNYPVFSITATADEQRKSAESRYDNLQQTLSKTKSELDESRQMESESKTTDLAVRGELESLRQQHEYLKVHKSPMLSTVHKITLYVLP
jgi:hypothetical protein